MEQVNIERAEIIVANLRKYIGDNDRLKELFTTQPAMKMEVYKKTSLFYAYKMYDEYLKSDEAIPHGFYAVLEKEIIDNGFIKTYKKYQKHIKNISELMNIPEKEMMLILRALLPQKPGIQDTMEQKNARNQLKEIIRKYTSINKENFIKKIINEKNALLESNTTKIEVEKKVNTLSPKSFIDWIFINPVLKESIISVINQRFNRMVNDYQLKDILEATFHENYVEELSKIFGYKKPALYDNYQANKDFTRLKKNYEQKMNNTFGRLPLERKFQILSLIEYKVKLKKELAKKNQPNHKVSIPNNELTNIKIELSKEAQSIIEEISTLLAESECKYFLLAGKFCFDLEQQFTKEESRECKEYKQQESLVKGFHNAIYKVYNQQNNAANALVKQAPTPLSTHEDQYQINADIWFTEDKIKSAIDAIDKNKITIMSEEGFKALKKFLIEDGFLWAFVADNIDLNTFAKIVNNFDSILACCNESEISIDNLQEIIKKANLYDYANDLIIGLVGLDITAKVINYNQFAETAETDEMIQKRLRKLVDLAVRSEYVDTSSLPYRCNVRSASGYKLLRYKNNDPQVFTSGVDTKTCFFISVNENDFFFYSLLNKNGYVIKVLNEKNELIARASCFRKNNVFMINGIRWKNNKIVADSKEEINAMIQVVNLFELMGKKMIELTKDDECPIDYIVCNKAGILENAVFESRFEQINSDLFREPINIYSDDWDDFIHMYDNCPEQMLQEVTSNDGRSFTTDFGNHYPALLLHSRNNIELTKPSHISYNDQPATYIRPRQEIEEYISEEITDKILAKINRIRALACFSGTQEDINYKTRNYKLLKNKSEIKAVALGEDWLIMIREDNTYEEVFARPTQQSLEEARCYMRNEKIKQKYDDNVKRYTLKQNKNL